MILAKQEKNAKPLVLKLPEYLQKNWDGDGEISKPETAGFCYFLNEFVRWTCDVFAWLEETYNIYPQAITPFFPDKHMNMLSDNFDWSFFEANNVISTDNRSKRTEG